MLVYAFKILILKEWMKSLFAIVLSTLFVKTKCGTLMVYRGSRTWVFFWLFCMLMLIWKFGEMSQKARRGKRKKRKKKNTNWRTKYEKKLEKWTEDIDENEDKKKKTRFWDESTSKRVSVKQIKILNKENEMFETIMGRIKTKKKRVVYIMLAHVLMFSHTIPIQLMSWIFNRTEGDQTRGAVSRSSTFESDVVYIHKCKRGFERTMRPSVKISL